MIPVSYYVPGELSSPKFAYAFAHGCRGTFTDDDELYPGPVALFGSPARWPLLRRAQAEGRDWYYGDKGYLGRKQGYFRITKNAYQHDGTGHATPERFASFRRPVQPWRRHGHHVLICPNSAVHFDLHGMDSYVWLAETMATLRQHTDRDIRVRWKDTPTKIHQDLLHAWAVVVYSSAAAVDALIAGIPVFVLAPFAAAYRMGLADLSRIERPSLPDDREPFLWNLADQQWTLSEICHGLAWRTLQTGGARAAA